MNIKKYVFDIKQLDDYLKENILLFKNKKISLDGNLGSGKTTFVKLLAKHLGFKDTITSPTFNKMMYYNGIDSDLVHIDAYNNISSLESFEDYFDNNTVVIEWYELIKEKIGIDVNIKIEFLDNDKREYKIEICK